ncbi:MAG: hypothetical protein OWT27_05385 [Firmicutes bacterium]|nr:hypothetical protein [Bacillota bacterium]
MRRAVFRTGMHRRATRLRAVCRLYAIAYVVGWCAGAAAGLALPPTIARALTTAFRTRAGGGLHVSLGIWSQHAQLDSIVAFASLACIWVFAQTAVAQLALPAVIGGWGLLAGLGSVLLTSALGMLGIWIDLLAVLPWNILAAGSLSAAAIHAHMRLPGWPSGVDGSVRARALVHVTLVCALVVWFIVLSGWGQARLAPIWLHALSLAG